MDLGSGGGLPGLVLATRWPDSHAVLVDSGTRRAAFLREAVTSLDLQDRVRVVLGRAEDLGRDPRWRGRFDAVVVRSFGPPAVVAECAAPFLKVGGLLVVSEPPGDVRTPLERWPAEHLAVLGLRPCHSHDVGRHYQVLEQVTPCPDRFPRRVGVPAKRPLFRTPGR